MSTFLGAIVERLRAEGLLAADAVEANLAMEVVGVTSDSRFVNPGALFCAVRGTAGDGHEFLTSALENGAVAALVERRDPEVPLTQLLVTNGRLAAAFAAAELYGDPWSEVKLIGVTGTNGKTTTVSILRHLLSTSLRTASVGTLGVVDPEGEVVPGTEGLTTPGPAQFAEETRKLVDRGVEAIAMEVSSHSLSQDRIAAARFSGAVFTNLSRDHLDYHGTVEDYRSAKLKLVDLVRSGGVIAVNADDPAWAGIGREGVHMVRFGTHGRGEVLAEDVRFSADGAEWHLHTPSCTAKIRMPLLGGYNVYNALGAAAVLWGLGWTSDRIAEGLATLEQVPGRLERVVGVNRPAVLIDYAHTPDALERAIAALRPLARGRLIVVFGAGGDRDRGKRGEMGRVVAANADVSIVTSDNPRHESPAAIAAEIEAGMGDAPRVRILDRRDAIAHALEIAGPDDLILLAGKGHENYQIWGDEYRPFDERAVVAEILAERGEST